MKLQGKITKINTELGYGFVTCGKTEVFFSAQTRFGGVTFDSLKMNDSVAIEVTETERGPFAEKLELVQAKPARRAPEATL